MKILLFDQRAYYLDLVINKLKHYFKNGVDIFICRNLVELEFYDCQVIDIVVILDNTMNLETIRLIKMLHHESDIICIGNNYFQIHEMIKMGITDYLIISIELETLCERIDDIMFNCRWSIALKGTGRKRIFVIHEIKYIIRNYDDYIIITYPNECFIVSVKCCCYLEYLFCHYFMQVNQSIMVNYLYIDYIKDYQLFLQSCENLLISCKYL